MMDLLLATSGGEAQAASGGYVDDVFSAYTYTGNGSTQTINNRIDLAGKGGLVWTKNRGSAQIHFLTDTIRGASSQLYTNNTNAAGVSTEVVTSFNSNGFSLGQYQNENIQSFVSWTFRKSPKFFDVVTFTATRSGAGWSGGPRVINHSLGVQPGMVIWKAVDQTSNWYVNHISQGANKRLFLNTTDTVVDTGAAYLTTSASNIVFENATCGIVGDGVTVTIVAYLFAHDPSAEGIIQCGSYVGNEMDGDAGVSVNLGWEPQWLLVKGIDTAYDWYMADDMRGFEAEPPHDGGFKYLRPNLSSAEVSSTQIIAKTSTGFKTVNSGSGVNQLNKTYIYLAIRRPNKPPTTGTQVYNAIARTGTGAAATVTGVGFAPDLVVARRRITTTIAGFVDRLRGRSVALYPNQAAQEVISSDTQDITAFLMDGISVGTSYNYGANPNGDPIINHFFRRAKGFFDVVCDTGTGVARAIAHNLTKAPELIIRKSRSAVTQWEVWHYALATTEKLVLNSDAAKVTDATAWNSTLPTSTQFTVGTGANVNTNAATYVTYLFATLAGISKVGSYTGNGTSQTINCGFATGARFILIKRTDATGDWYVWDTVRGIVAANDPHLSLNTTAEEVTTDDSVDPDASGFIVNQNTATNINVNSGQYIFLAIA